MLIRRRRLCSLRLETRLLRVEEEKDKLQQALNDKTSALCKLVSKHRMYVSQLAPVAEQLAALQHKAKQVGPLNRHYNRTAIKPNRH